MIQIIQAVPSADGSKTSYRYTTPPIILHTLSQVYKNCHGIIAEIEKAGGDRNNLFYCLAHHTGAQSSAYPARTRSTFEYQTVLAFDLDAVDTTRWGEYLAVIAEILKAPAEAFTCMNSGNGLHVIAGLKHPIRSVEFFDDTKPAYQEVCKQADVQIRKLGLPIGKVDPVVFEPARILRLPGSLNVKKDKEPKECSLLQISDSLLELDLFKLSGLASRQSENVPPAEIKRKYPTPDFPHMLKECQFLGWAKDFPDEVHEPHAFDFFSLMAPCEGAKTESGQTPRQLAEAVFLGATASASLKQADFDEKWEQAKEYGGRKCSTIDDHWGKCSACPHFGKALTPLALKSPVHIASKVNGYWILNGDGLPGAPAYEDLSRVYRDIRPIVVTPEERILAYGGSVYTEVAEIEVKAWLDDILIPTEPLKRNHRTEFLDKVKHTSFITLKKSAEVFTLNIATKLNCLNGALDLRTGEMEDHSADLGFMYQLPYAVDLNAEPPEFFIEWLSQVTQDRVELIESLLDLMAYVLWPTYDDHVFAYLIGDGANGKSTFVDLIQTMVGPEAYSAIGLHHLCQNRFAPAQLEGKLVNVSSESSGSGQELESESLNILKSLSAGEPVFIERKGKDGYTFCNRAKLIFSANSPPHFREAGHALERRMLVIPFDFRIENPDPRVGAKLRAEMPQIVPFLVRRIQANIQMNGTFKVSRGGQAAAMARKKLMTEYNTVVAWSQEALDVGSECGTDAHIEVAAAYQHYQDWCSRNGYRTPQTKVAFGKSMCNFVLTALAREGSVSKRVGGKAVRVYIYARFKQGVEVVQASN